MSKTLDDIITAVTLDKTHQNIAYFGSKDTSIYQVDLTQGVATEPFSNQHGIF